MTFCLNYNPKTIKKTALNKTSPKFSDPFLPTCIVTLIGLKRQHAPVHLTCTCAHTVRFYTFGNMRVKCISSVWIHGLCICPLVSGSSSRTAVFFFPPVPNGLYSHFYCSRPTMQHFPQLISSLVLSNHSYVPPVHLKVQFKLLESPRKSSRLTKKMPPSRCHLFLFWNAVLSCFNYSNRKTAEALLPRLYDSSPFRKRRVTLKRLNVISGGLCGVFVGHEEPSERQRSLLSQTGLVTRYLQDHGLLEAGVDSKSLQEDMLILNGFFSSCAHTVISSRSHFQTL